MSKVYFIDLDGTLVPHGNPRGFIPGAKEALDAIARDPDNQIYFFSCWAFTPHDCAWLQTVCPYAKGFIRKPLGDSYVFIDDKLAVKECATSLTNDHPR